ncbi:LysR family transcriptional regulator [Thetidibacter halocola]|nr:LysR family transcriptional regulator [Thetidibacter halocola]
MLNLRQLEIFREVMRTRTTIGAAKALTISQPAVSNAIRQMESQVGMTLFERTGNRLVPTPEAEEIFRGSEAVFSLYHAFSHRIEGLRRREVGELRILATPPIANAILPGALRSFLGNRPDVRISIDTRRVDGVIEGVETRMADIGLAVMPPERDYIDAIHVATGQMVCAFPPGHPLEDKLAVTVDDLRKYALVVYEPKSRFNLMLQRSYFSADLHRNIVAEVRYSSLGCLLAEAGIGVTIVDSFTGMSGDRYRLSYRPLYPRQEIKAYAMVLRGEKPKRLVSAFLDEMAKLDWDEDPREQSS